MKRILSCIFICLMSALIFFQMNYPVYAMICPDIKPPPSLGGDGEQNPIPPVQILGVNKNYNEEDTQFEMITIEKGGTIDEKKLPQMMDCITDTSDMFGTFRYWCPVVWDLSQPVDTKNAGRINICGTLTPPDGYKMAEGVSPEVTLSITVMGEREAENIETLRHIKSDLPEVYLIKQEKAIDTLILSDRAYCFTQNLGEYFNCPMQIDISKVDTNKNGAYITSATPVLPSGFALPNGYLPVKITLRVMPDDIVDLSGAYYEPSQKVISCNWIYKIPEDMPVRLEYAIDKGEWQEDDIYISYSKYFGASLKVRLEQLSVQKDYYFRMIYGFEENKKTSDILHIRLENLDFMESEDKAPIFDIGGDRDGGDIGGDEQPDLIQPLPPVTINPPPQTEPIIDYPKEIIPVETVTETSTILSGGRLAQLMENKSSVLFEKQGVAVELPTAFLSGLDISKEQLLEVTINRLAQAEFSLFINADNKAATVLPDTVVRMPWDLKNQAKSLECVDKDGTHISDVVLEKESETAQFTICATGVYRIQEQKNNAVSKNPLPIAAVLDTKKEEKSAEDEDNNKPQNPPVYVKEAVDEPIIKEAEIIKEQTVIEKTPPIADAQIPAVKNSDIIKAKPVTFLFLAGILLIAALFILWRWRHGKA